MSYEFDSDADDTIATLAGAMQNVGMVGLFGGMIGFVAELQPFAVAGMAGFTGLFLLGLAATVLPIVISALMIGAGRTLMAIPRTEGNDMPLLMQSMRKLTWIYVLECVVALATIGIVAVVVVGRYA